MCKIQGYICINLKGYFDQILQNCYHCQRNIWNYILTNVQLIIIEPWKSSSCYQLQPYFKSDEKMIIVIKFKSIWFIKNKSQREISWMEICCEKFYDSLSVYVCCALCAGFIQRKTFIYFNQNLFKISWKCSHSWIILHIPCGLNIKTKTKTNLKLGFSSGFSYELMYLFSGESCIRFCLFFLFKATYPNNILQNVIHIKRKFLFCFQQFDTCGNVLIKNIILKILSI